MRTDGVMRQTMMVGAMVVAAWLSAPATQAADQRSTETTFFASTESLGIMASGAVEDSLKACLARIPKDASEGLRLIAMQGCERDDETRQAIRSVPSQ
jgi:hypothetical protein